LPSEWRESALRLAILLRVAVLLNRSRTAIDLSGVAAAADRNCLYLKFPNGWLEVNPLTIADLEREREYLGELDYDLQFGPADPG
jgi:exopolyphosphatase/guanosine-5'-triphosphate,3'-diphosphate pyrophosphatase